MSKDLDMKTWEDEEEEEIEERGPGKLSLRLNQFFHHLDRGGSLGGELTAGLTMALLAICVIFMNMQAIGKLIAGSYTPGNSPLDPDNIALGTTYARLYAGGVLISVIGTIVIGIVANLPLVQISTMGIFSSVICLIGAESGLTYQNILVINLIAGVVYTVFTAVPVLRKTLQKALPAVVKKALPAAFGAIVLVAALRLSGFISFGAVHFGVNGGSVISYPNGFSFAARDLQTCALIGAVAAVAIYALFKCVKKKHASLLALLVGTLIFAVLSITMNGVDTANSESFANFGRVWLVAGSQASAKTPFGDSYLTYAADAVGSALSYAGSLFSQGFDFSTYTGSGLALIVGACLTYLLSGVYTAQSVISATKENEDDSKALLVNGTTNVVAPFLGMGGVTLSSVGVAGAKDGAKSGIASVFAGILTMISLFVMAFPAIFATETYPVGSMNQWNYFAYGNGGFIYLVQGAVFSIVDIVMACVGVSMVISVFKGIKGKELVPLVVMLVAALLTTNIVAAAALGSVCAIALDRKEATVPAIAFAVIGVLSVILI